MQARAYDCHPNSRPSQSSCKETVRRLPVVHECNEVLLPFLTKNREDLLSLGIQHLPLLCNLVSQGLQLCCMDRPTSESKLGVAWHVRMVVVLWAGRQKPRFSGTDEHHCHDYSFGTCKLWHRGQVHTQWIEELQHQQPQCCRYSIPLCTCCIHKPSLEYSNQGSGLSLNKAYCFLRHRAAVHC